LCVAFFKRVKLAFDHRWWVECVAIYTINCIFSGVIRRLQYERSCVSVMHRYQQLSHRYKQHCSITALDWQQPVIIIIIIKRIYKAQFCRMPQMR